MEGKEPQNWSNFSKRNDMNRNEPETVKLFKGLMKRSHAKEIKDCGDGLDDGMIAFTENLMRHGL